MIAIFKRIRTFLLSVLIFGSLAHSPAWAETDYVQFNNDLNGIDITKAINESNKPYVADRQNMTESVDAQSGSLTYKQTDLVLPGRDGLDLNISRIYQSAQAQMGEAESALIHSDNTSSPYYAKRLYYVWAFIGTYSDGVQGVLLDGQLYKERAEAVSKCEAYASANARNYAYTHCSIYMSSGATTTIGSKDYTLPYKYYTEYLSWVTRAKNTNDLRSRYDLGAGWSFGFPYVQVIDLEHGSTQDHYTHYHDGNGASFRYTGSPGSGLEGYDDKDVKFGTDTTYSNGQNSSQFAFTASDQRKSFFATDGRLLGIKDRFGNEIKFTYITRQINGTDYPFIDEIIDSIGRKVKFTYDNAINSSPFNGDNITLKVTQPDSSKQIVITYTKMRDQVDGRNEPYLWKVTYAQGTAEQTETIYEYQKSPQKFAYNMFGPSATLYSQLLQKVIYPHSVSFYEYASTSRKLGTGSFDAFRVTHRYDQDRTSSNNNPSLTASVNLAYQKPVTTSSAHIEYYDEGWERFEGSRAVDGYDMNEYYWEPEYNDTNISITVDLGSVQPFNEVEMQWAPNNYGVHYTISTSNDNNNPWTTLAQTQHGSPDIETSSGFQATGRYVKLQITKSDTLYSSGPRLYELKVYNRTQKNNKSYGYYLDYANGSSNYKTSVTDQTGVTQTFVYAANQSLMKTQTRNAKGEEKEVAYAEYSKDFKTKPTRLQITEYGKEQFQYNTLYVNNTYNTWGGLSSTTKPMTSTELANEATKKAYTTTYTYDSTYYFPTQTEHQQTDQIKVTERSEYYASNQGGKAGRLKQTTNAMGDIVTYDYELNGEGKVTKAIVTQSLENGKTARTETEYSNTYKNAFPTVVRTYYTNENNQWVSTKTTQEYDLLTGNVTAMTDDSGRKTSYEYDALGRTVSVHMPPYTGNNNTQYEAETKTTYTPNQTSSLFDGTNTGRKTMKISTLTKVAYKENNQPIAKEYNQTENYYDGFGNLLLQTAWNSAANAWIAMQQNHFDAVGRPVYTVGASADASTIEYEPWGRVTKVVDPFGVAYVSEYDLLGRKQTSYRQSGSATENYTVQQVDTWGRVTKTSVYPNYPEWTAEIASSFAYDWDGNTVSQTDPKGYTTTYAYDKMNRLAKIVDPLNQTSEYQYSKLGALLQMKQGDSSTSYTTTKAYDERGLSIRHTNAGNETETSGYNNLGLLQSHKDPSGNVFSYAYDQWNRQTARQTGSQKYTSTYNEVPYGPLKVAEWAGATEARTTTYQYGGLGQVAEIANSYDGITQSQRYTYDSQGKLIKLKDPGDFTTQYQYEKTRLSKVQVNGSASDPFSTNVNQYAQYSYDAMGRLQSIVYPGGQVKAAYTYDKLGRVTKVTNTKSGATLSQYEYSYDKNGNVESVTDATGTTRYEYDGLNRLKRTVHPNNAVDTYEYDVRGNRKRLESGTGVAVFTDASYSYDKFDQLVSANQGGSASFQYDANGLRLKKDNGQAATRYVYNASGQVIAEANASNQVTASYVWGDRLLVKQEKGSSGLTPYYYLYNGHGDVVQIVDAAGNVKNAYQYDEWGNIDASKSKEEIQNTFKYAGEQLDAETGLYYLRARYYDPSVGRFINKDTYEGDITNPLSLNLYTYVHNNPLTNVDPTGHWCISADGNNVHDKGCSSSSSTESYDIDHDGEAMYEDGVFKGYYHFEFTEKGVREDYATEVGAVGVIASCIVSCPTLVSAAAGGADVATMGTTTGSVVGGAAVAAKSGSSWGTVKSWFSKSEEVVEARGVPFNSNARTGEIQMNVNPNTITPSRDLNELSKLPDYKRRSQNALEYFDNPIIVSRQGVIIDGHHRLQIALKNNWPVNVIIK
ncbi:discoidin domain-containing protein [Paenibacillus doosanensis]|uniref:RHS repeat-associated core domain-containing protein n=1 Tax=Paenibacillus doosanensis TaxID=1229154 RepID=UPI00217FF392|nr:RHS repeat-associated core domain-containing protein [Paenibacillus doosanensis]MCS7464395.1 discoidin domain-containing protein [Paenibacillus doosanensis]